MKTKMYFWSVLVLLASLNLLQADQFHITRTTSAGTADVGYATVKIMEGKKTLFSGKTDKYGRITIKLPNGKYEAAVTRGGEKIKVALAINGKKRMKEVNIK